MNKQKTYLNLIFKGATLSKLHYSNHELKQNTSSKTAQNHAQSAAATCATCRTYENLILAKMSAKRSCASGSAHGSGRDKRRTSTRDDETIARQHHDTNESTPLPPPSAQRQLPVIQKPLQASRTPITTQLMTSSTTTTKTSESTVVSECNMGANYKPLEYTLFKCKLNHLDQVAPIEHQIANKNDTVSIQ